MRKNVVVYTAASAVAVALSAVPARAQLYEDVGIRAQGMAGAFVAIADDATATWWNPAGLATGASFNSILEYSQIQEPRTLDAGGQPLAARESRTRGFAMAFPALGLSYYHLQISEIQPLTPTGVDAQNRQDPGTVAVRLHALTLDQFGATIGQSLGRYLVIGSTLKLVRGSVGATLVAPADATFDVARGLGGETETHADLDLGAMARMGPLHLGLTVKNVRQPEFGPADNRYMLQREARAGLAVVAHPKGALNQIAVAVDTDLTRNPTAFGDARYLAGGVEAWLLKRRVGLRGGVSGNTVGERRTSPSAGGSLAFKSGLYLDGQYTAGSDEARHGWGVGLRVTF